jgi:histidine triad (HIT) family protein
MDCIFCKIVSGEINHWKVYEDENVIAFLDVNPAVHQGGHTLVIPKKHYELITDVPDEELKGLMIGIKTVSKALMKFGHGINVVQNNGKVAGQVVPHLHFHLIPRFEGDEVKICYWDVHKLDDRNMVEIQEKIKSLLNE